MIIKKNVKNNKNISIGIITVKKRMITNLLALTIFSNMVVAEEIKGPSVERTIQFLNKVFNKNSNTYSEVAGDDRGSYYDKPKFNLKSECKVEIESNYFTNDSFISDIIYADFSIHKIYVKEKSNEDKSEKSYQMVIHDRNDVKTVKIYRLWYDTENDKALDAYNNKVYNLRLNGTNEELRTILYTKFKSERTFTTNDMPFDINVNGKVYKEKVNKALEHLTNICYKKYGGKEDDPF